MACNGNLYRYEYNADGSPHRLVMPGGIVETLRYDAGGRVVERRETRPGGGDTTLHHDQFVLGAESKVLQVVTTPDDNLATMSYTGFGAVRDAILSMSRDNHRVIDPLGNIVRNDKFSEADVSLVHSFDKAGNQYSRGFTSWVDTTFRVEMRVGPPLWAVASFSTLTNRFSADGRLVAAERRTSEDVNRTDRDALERLGQLTLVSAPSLGRGVYEEYRDDALGRRVWVRAHRTPYCPAGTTATTDCLGSACSGDRARPRRRSCCIACGAGRWTKRRRWTARPWNADGYSGRAASRSRGAAVRR